MGYASASDVVSYSLASTPRYPSSVVRVSYDFPRSSTSFYSGRINTYSSRPDFRNYSFQKTFEGVGYNSSIKLLYRSTPADAYSPKGR